MSDTSFGPPPSGLDLTASHHSKNNAAVISTYILAAGAIALRWTTRYRMQDAAIAADDWMILAAWISVTASFVCTIIGGNYGLGKHVWSVAMTDIMKLMRILFAYVLIYVVTVPLIKLSILLLYRRIFGMSKAIWFCAVLTIGYWLSCTIAFLVCCRPVSYYWRQYADPSSGRCVFNLYPFYIGNAVANLITDKVLVCGIFMLGGFVCIASVIRLYYLTFLKTSVDITWVIGDVFIWSSVEPCVGILCACLPTLQPLLRYAVKRFASSRVGRYILQSSGGKDSTTIAEGRRTVEMNNLSRENDADEQWIAVETKFELGEELRR
ncbi:uncharacterized protein BO95DRAFT_461005 [Aspergillus brunneoviolaceus CBS 621.78]|uniref:Uncharacterized protein n=1 Tax=Aspergillus brunneoviolaceus CBS 621.78 TaxID=1450534 RepID=A0ACD1GHM4_9EURO|nr:hypothetical protein BO95DRAFT_461005 [Aspergillus brunneoviolaceus CBS 621.78]RAH48747.1 hypothetical protein BO95DRAFT_461005 [Aspergillus brunneoviolaceus CBS 621.78]